MLFYWCVFILIFFIAVNKGKHRFAIVATILLFLGATRAISVGSDLRGGYSLEYGSIQLDPSTWGHYMSQFEIGFSWMMVLFKTYVFSSPIYFFQLLFFATFLFLALFVRKYSKYPAMTLFFMYSLSYYFSLYNIMRQEWCFALICFFCISAYLDSETKNVEKPNHFVKFILPTIGIVVLAYLFHKSQIVLLLVLPLYLLKDQKCFGTKYLIAYMIFTIFFSMTFAEKIFSGMNSIAYLFADDNSNTAGYMTYSENIGMYSTTANIVNTFFAIYITLAYRGRKSFFLVLFVLGVCLQNVLTPISWIFARIANTFLFFKIFVMADLWYEIPNKKERLIYRIVVLLYSIAMFNNRLINDRFQDVVPYVNHYLKAIL